MHSTLRASLVAATFAILLAACGSPAASGPHLVGTVGAVTGQSYAVAPTGRTTIGRLDDCNIVISGDETVSRHHAYIEAASGSYVLSDDSSTNGTFVNGARITQQTLAAGDVVTLGAQSLRFDL
jgi:predicted component of type VI protein secretion system